MLSKEPKIWLLLTHHIPAKSNTLRVKIWRRLQRVGAVAIKQTVYVLPLSDQSREDLSWILKEILESGGDGSISEAKFLEGLTDEQVIALFQNARKFDYEKIIHESNRILAERHSGRIDPMEQGMKNLLQVSRLQHRLDEIAAIDFFQTPERSTTEILLNDLSDQISGEVPKAAANKQRIDRLKGKIWVTRENLFVDRMGCGWLIRRFVDSEAVFRFVHGPRYARKPGELRFDMFDSEYTHEGDRCTFEVMIQRLHLKDRALAPMAEMVHDIDLKDAKYNRSETDGFHALLSGLISAQTNDEERMHQGIQLFENLYVFFRRQRKGFNPVD